MKWFPNAGTRITNGSTYYVGSGGLYWSSDQYTAPYAYYLYFSSGPAGSLSDNSKLRGFPGKVAATLIARSILSLAYPRYARATRVVLDYNY